VCALVLPLDEPVALTGFLCRARRVENADIATAMRDQGGFLKLAGGFGQKARQTLLYVVVLAASALPKRSSPRKSFALILIALPASCTTAQDVGRGDHGFEKAALAPVSQMPRPQSPVRGHDVDGICQKN
jgi:hypothetical protein